MRYVVTPEVAIRLAETGAPLAGGVKLVAPTLIRSQVLAILFERVRDGELTQKEASAHLDHLRGLKIRLLGDRVLQSVAWKVAAELGWPDTYTAEYVALTTLQADALVTLDGDLATTVSGLARVAPMEELLA